MKEYTRPRTRNPGKGKYCEKHKRWHIDFGGKKRCKDCWQGRMARKAERLAKAAA